jgi:three-Cys-motif partner protein
MHDIEQLGEDGLLIDTVGTWSEDKYRLVSLYATMFARSMRDKFDALIYIDMFAGPGRVRVKDTSRIYASSPINALDIDPIFDTLIFCEHGEDRMGALQARCAAQYPGRDIHFIPGDVNANAAEVLSRVPQYRKNFGVLTLCFVDPFKMSNLSFDTLKVFRERWVDFLVLIPSEMDAQRGEHGYVADDNATVETFLSNREWRAAWTAAKSRGIRFEQFIVEEFGNSMQRIDRINPELTTTHVMKNTVNRTLYRLVLYSRSKIAGKFWSQAQKYANPNRELAF